MGVQTSHQEMPKALAGLLVPKPGKTRRILCYGDSLTAGYHDKGNQFEPYGQVLAKTLKAAGIACEISVCGLSGHTANRMVSEVDAAVCIDVKKRCGKGLGRMLKEDGPFDLVLLMAGTNDLGKSFPAEQILGDVQQLHTVCHSLGVPTVALLPPHPWQEKRNSFGKLLRSWAWGESQVLHVLDPEELIPRENATVWEPDRLHFSPVGSRSLGQKLATLVLPLFSRGPAKMTSCAVPRWDSDEAFTFEPSAQSLLEARGFSMPLCGAPRWDSVVTVEDISQTASVEYGASSVPRWVSVESS